jgi:hypothetical protein
LGNHIFTSRLIVGCRLRVNDDGSLHSHGGGRKGYLQL